MLLWLCTLPAECNFFCVLHKWKTVGISVAALRPVLFNVGFTHQQSLLQSY